MRVGTLQDSEDREGKGGGDVGRGLRHECHVIWETPRRRVTVLTPLRPSEGPKGPDPLVIPSTHTHRCGLTFRKYSVTVVRRRGGEHHRIPGDRRRVGNDPWDDDRGPGVPWTPTIKDKCPYRVLEDLRSFLYRGVGTDRSEGAEEKVDRVGTLPP